MREILTLEDDEVQEYHNLKENYDQTLKEKTKEGIKAWVSGHWLIKAVTWFFMIVIIISLWRNSAC